MDFNSRQRRHHNFEFCILNFALRSITAALNDHLSFYDTITLLRMALMAFFSNRET